MAGGFGLCGIPETLTAQGVVDLMITDLAVFDVSQGKKPLTLLQLADGVSLDEVKAKTEAPFGVAPATVWPPPHLPATEPWPPRDQTGAI